MLIFLAKLFPLNCGNYLCFYTSHYMLELFNCVTAQVYFTFCSSSSVRV